MRWRNCDVTNEWVSTVIWTQPSPENAYIAEHAFLIASNFRRRTGRTLVPDNADRVEQARLLWEAPFAVVSHTAEPEPRFNYGNRTALRLWEMTWEEFTAMLSRHSAPPVHQEERERLLRRVAAQGYADSYRGVRITSSGRRFWLEDGIIWNLDDEGVYRGQAAMFGSWTPIHR